GPPAGPARGSCLRVGALLVGAPLGPAQDECGDHPGRGPWALVGTVRGRAGGGPPRRNWATKHGKGTEKRGRGTRSVRTGAGQEEESSSCGVAGANGGLPGAARPVAVVAGPQVDPVDGGRLALRQPGSPRPCQAAALRRRQPQPEGRPRARLQ